MVSSTCPCLEIGHFPPRLHYAAFSCKLANSRGLRVLSCVLAGIRQQRSADPIQTGVRSRDGPRWRMLVGYVAAAWSPQEQRREHLRRFSEG